MKKHLKALLFVAFFAGITTMQSQEYLKMIEEGTHSVQEIVANAEAYFANRDKGRGTGYKQFKRWEYNATRLMNEDGYLRSVSENIAEWESYNAYLNETAQSRPALLDNWQELGPVSWNATTSWNPGVGRITAISVDKTDNDHIIVGANTGGVWRTTDAGQNWTPLNDDFSNLAVYSVAIDPSNSSTYYFGSNSGMIFKSTDSGATWDQIGDINNSNINKILIHPTNSDIMFVTGSGVYATFDGGTTWTQPVSDSSGYDVEFKPGDLSVVYASGSGVHKSVDGGQTFTTISGFSNGPKMIGVSADDANVVYVLEANGGSFGGLYKSVNSGSSFSELDHSGRNYFGYDTNGFDSGGQAPRDMDIAVKPNDVDEVHIAGVLTWRSTDGGVSFNNTSDWIPNDAANANVGYCHADVDILEFEGTTLYVGTDGGIFKAENTNTVSANYFEDITEGMGIRQFYKIGVSQTEDVVVTGGAQDNGTSFYTEAGGWKDWLGADGMEGFVDKTNSNTMYGMIQNGGMYRTSNAGTTITNIVEPGQASGEWVTPFEQDPVLVNTIYVGYNIVYKSTNRGFSWEPISQVLNGNLDHLKIAPSNNLIMYAANSGTLYRTDDGGATNWVTTANPGGIIRSVAIHPTNPNKVAVASSTTNKVYVSNDGGATWINYKKNLPNFSSLALVWDDNGQDGLYLGMDYGVYYIDNTFTEWQPYSNNLPNVIINELDINNETNMLYAATYGRGLWVSPLVEDNLGVADKLSGESIQVHPNPATNELTISLAETIEADVRVFDVLGKVKIYEANVFLDNNHTINLESLASGVYFVRINSEKGTVTKKFIKN
ncbi:T9SS type A sorting domain-containing protein [Ulvibacter litoralis]|uniref:Por secretion system C-terminal sorting domain-containing protein n=1 Tax=Ulvibacter litoralis TaxID=227084 RepID=A0A1G7IV27_9FLAO|nr:T9SS type A sorting domain-containing protein [Ulvibacter litoralis]GHC63348.1 hypothetical protein GCM10008083_30790 [Ulvibacter litoralis]SDF16475.1 Por secretion system C-terminal sorting domain-containing protein [Ulvibacter litoralis]